MKKEHNYHSLMSNIPRLWRIHHIGTSMWQYHENQSSFSISREHTINHRGFFEYLVIQTTRTQILPKFFTTFITPPKHTPLQSIHIYATGSEMGTPNPYTRLVTEDCPSTVLQLIFFPTLSTMVFDHLNNKGFFPVSQTCVYFASMS